MSSASPASRFQEVGEDIIVDTGEVAVALRMEPIEHLQIEVDAKIAVDFYCKCSIILLQ